MPRGIAEDSQKKFGIFSEKKTLNKSLERFIGELLEKFLRITFGGIDKGIPWVIL